MKPLKSVVKRDTKFKPGNCANPNGRPRKPEIEMFRLAIEQVEKEKGTSLLVHAVQRAYVEDTVLVALLKKILPDKLDPGGTLVPCVALLPAQTKGESGGIRS